MLAMFSFSAINVYSTIEIGLHSLDRKKVGTSFKLNENIIRSQYSCPRKKTDLSVASQAVKKPQLRAIFFAVRFRNAIQRNDLKLNITSSWI